MIKEIIKNKLCIKQKPSFITFFVTWRCNCKCIMCNIWKKKTQHNELSLEEINKIFKDLGKLDAVRISGGEPFLRTDIGEIINIINAQSNPKIIHITTNGLLTNNIINSLKKVIDGYKIHIKVSIDNVYKQHDRIRGVEGCFDKAKNTVEQLSILAKTNGMFVGINQTITNYDDYCAYFALRDYFRKFDVKIFCVLAYNTDVGLYNNKLSPINSTKMFTNFSKDELEEIIKTLEISANSINNISERLLKKYYVLGLKNRLLKGVNKPNPKCVALNNHLRILPNGDVPICLYNPKIVGNLKNNTIKEIWFNKKILQHKKWVSECVGCWAGCETNVSAIYTGDIIKMV